MKKFEYNPTCYKPSLFEEMEKIIREFFDLPVWETITDETTWEDLGADSLDVFQIIMGIEQEFDIVIDTDAAEKIVTVADAVAQIKNASEK